MKQVVHGYIHVYIMHELFAHGLYLQVLSFKLNVGQFPHLADLVTRINYNCFYMSDGATGSENAASRTGKSFPSRADWYKLGYMMPLYLPMTAICSSNLSFFTLFCTYCKTNMTVDTRSGAIISQVIRLLEDNFLHLESCPTIRFDFYSFCNFSSEIFLEIWIL